MKIEDEIKQTAFTNEYQKLIINILFTGIWLRANNAKFLKPYGLTPEQYNILRILRGQYPNPASVNLLVERMLDKSSNASRIVSRLVIKNLVESKICSKDKRQLDIIITTKGLEVLTQVDVKINMYESLSSRISIDQAQIINDALDKIRE